MKAAELSPRVASRAMLPAEGPPPPPTIHAALGQSSSGPRSGPASNVINGLRVNRCLG